MPRCACAGGPIGSSASVLGAVRGCVALGAGARRLAGGRARSRVDRDRRRLPGRPDAVPGLDPQRRSPLPRLEPVRAPGHAGRLLHARGGDLGRPHRARGSGLARRCCCGSRLPWWPRSSPFAPTRTAAWAGSGSGGVRSCLGLFFGSVTIIYGSVGHVGDLFPPFLSWGYTFGLLALAAMMFALRGLRRVPTEAGAAEISWATAAARRPGQPAASLAGRVARADRDRGRAGRLVPGSAAPDPGAARPHSAAHRPAAALLPDPRPRRPLLAAGPGGEQARVLAAHHRSRGTPAACAGAGRLPPLAPVLFGLDQSRLARRGAGHLRALRLQRERDARCTRSRGSPLPLAVLAIEGIRRLGLARLPGRRVLVGLAVALFTVPGILYQLHSSSQLAAPSPGNANFITRDERTRASLPGP